MIFDLYDGRQWWSLLRPSACWSPRTSRPWRPSGDEMFVDQTVRVLADTRALVALPSPKWFGLPVQERARPGSGRTGPDRAGHLRATSRRLLAAGEVYQALSATSVATKEELRQASTLPAVAA